MQKALALWGGVDVLSNNAAYVTGPSGPLLNASLEAWNKQFEVSVTGTFLMPGAVCLK